MKTLFLILVITTLNSCNGQNKQTASKKDTIMETFDIETFNKHKEKDIYEYTSDDSTLIREQVYKSGDYTRIVQYKNNDFSKFYRFYPNGSLKIKGKFFEKNFDKDIWSYFDKKGNVQKEIDLDKPYLYTWKNIKQYLMQHKVENIQKEVLSIRRFNEQEETEYTRKGAYWELEFKGEYNNIKGQFFIELDGKTGEELLVKKFKGKGALGEDATIAVYDTLYVKKEKN